MTKPKQPEALRLAELLELAPEDGVEPQTAEDAAAELRRQHTENTALQQGYAAARLEIESLQARIKTMAEEHADELMVAHLDGMRAAQPAGAQQPGTAYAALPDADRDYMRKVVAVAVTMLFDGYKEDVMRVFSTGELSEFVTITAAMRVDQVEDIYRRAWDLLSLPARASHGQAPAQAAPAHPACKPDILVNTGALKLALSVLRRAGKDEVADELEKTAQPSPTSQADSQPAPVLDALPREDFA